MATEIVLCPLCGADFAWDPEATSLDDLAADPDGRLVPIAYGEHVRAHFTEVQPLDAEDAVRIPDDEAGQVCWYVNAESGIDPDEDPAVSAEFLGSETVFGLEHPYWRVATRTGKTSE
jgi:hypothetical protein